MVDTHSRIFKKQKKGSGLQTDNRQTHHHIWQEPAAMREEVSVNYWDWTCGVHFISMIVCLWSASLSVCLLPVYLTSSLAGWLSSYLVGDPWHVCLCACPTVHSLLSSFICTCMSVCMLFWLTVSPSVWCLAGWRHMYVPSCLVFCLSVCLSVGRSVGQSVGQSVGRWVSQSVGQNIYLDFWITLHLQQCLN